MFNALREHGPLTYNELYLAVRKIFAGAGATEIDSCLFRMRERGEVKRAGLRPPGEHLFQLA
jgi:hypothetical protein